LGEVILGDHTLRFLRHSGGGDDAEPTEGGTTEGVAKEDCVEAVVCGEGNEAVQVENGDENAATNAKKTLTRHPPEVPYDRVRKCCQPSSNGFHGMTLSAVCPRRNTQHPHVFDGPL
jgi:hypothetical protein